VFVCVGVTVLECGAYRPVGVECSAVVQTAVSKCGTSTILFVAARPALLPMHSESVVIVQYTACVTASLFQLLLLYCCQYILRIFNFYNAEFFN